MSREVTIKIKACSKCPNCLKSMDSNLDGKLNGSSSKLTCYHSDFINGKVIIRHIDWYKYKPVEYIAEWCPLLEENNLEK